MKILVVDDEEDICEILQYNLEAEGYEVHSAHSAEEALALSLSDFDLILLDVMMGEISGFQLASLLKSNPRTAQVPVIFITALDGEDDVVHGLNLGADDYIAKPLSIREVKARVRTVLRRSGSLRVSQDEKDSVDVPHQLSYMGLSLNLVSKNANIDGDELQLTKLEFELLALFLQYPNTVFSREELLSRCWPHDVFVLERTVDVNIARLRKKLGKLGDQIKARVGYGYCFEK